MISIEAKQIMVEQYVEVKRVTSQEVLLQMKDYILHLMGEDLHIVALSKFEILVEGKLEGITFIYEK